MSSACLRAARAFRRLAGRVAALARHEAGLAAVEFSLILPIMVVLWIGGVELTQALSIDRRLNNLASAVGDLVARSKIVTYGDVDQIFDIAPGAMFPYSGTGVQMRVSAVDINDAGNAKVAWSRAEGTTAYAKDLDVNTLVPATLRVKNTQLIMAEVSYVYRPTVGYVIIGDKTLDDRMFFVPRLTTYVKLCDNSGANCVS